MSGTLLLCAAAIAGELTLGEGRAAVLAPASTPTGVTIGDADLIEILAVPPHLIVLARRDGRSDLTVDHEDGQTTWSVRVVDDAAVDPTGGPGVVDASSSLVLRPEEGVLLSLDDAPSAHTVIDTDHVQLHPIRDDLFYVQVDRAGVFDLVFERGRHTPRIWTLRTADPVGPLPRPDGVIGPAETLTLPAGGERVIQVEGAVRKLLVGHPSRLAVERIAPDQLSVRALRAGETTLVVDLGPGRPVWVRRVVMTPPSGQ